MTPIDRTIDRAQHRTTQSTPHKSIGRSAFAFVAFALLLQLGSTKRAAAADPRWQLAIAATTAQSTPIFGADDSPGWGVGLEYRASRRLGVELDVLGNRIEDGLEIDFFGAELDVKQSFRATWLLSRLNFHLTPDSRVDLVVGPVLGHLETGDLTLEVRSRIPGGQTVVEKERTKAKGGVAGGAHLRLDIRLGQGRSYLTTGATYLRSRVKVAEQPDGERLSFDFDPLIVHLGYSVRF